MRRARDWLAGAVAMLLVLVVGVVVLFLVVSDPAGEGTAEDAGSSSPPARDGSTAGVLPSELGEGEVWYSGVELAADLLVTTDSTLRDVSAVAQDVVTRPGGLVAGTVTVDATVPFEVVEDELGDDTTLAPAPGEQAAVTRTVEVLGRDVRVVATGTVEVQDGRLVVVPRSIALGGSDVLADRIADAVRRLVTITYDVDELPEGLVLEDVTVQDDGFRVRLLGDDIQLVQ